MSTSCSGHSIYKNKIFFHWIREVGFSSNKPRPTSIQYGIERLFDSRSMADWLPKSDLHKPLKLVDTDYGRSQLIGPHKSRISPVDKGKGRQGRKLAAKALHQTDFHSGNG